MRFSIAPALLLLAGAADAASKWSFADGTIKVASKGAASDATFKIPAAEPLKTPVKLGPADTIKVSLIAKEGSKSKRPHQAFLVVGDDAGLETPFALAVKESGLGTVEFTQKDLPVQLLRSTEPLAVNIVIGSFGSSAGSVSQAFQVQLERDPNVAWPKYEAPLRYGKRDEIHHIFRADPKSPPKIVSLVFALAVLATVPAVFLGWGLLGGNVDHLQKALGTAPVSHSVFFGSIIALEGVFFLYYTSWKLFDILPFLIVIGGVAFLSGSKALGEVQSRRLAGER